MKIHRLGRVSFKNVKSKRDYLLHRKSASWLYMSRLAATREYSFLQALYQHEFPTPRPVDHNRHCIIMSLVKAHPFGQVRHLRHPARLYNKLMNLIVRLAEHGLIHGDFNEFNLMVNDDEEVWIFLYLNCFCWIYIDFRWLCAVHHRPR
jgi:RIO kinase 2